MKKPIKVILLILLIVVLCTQCSFAVNPDVRLKEYIKKETSKNFDEFYHMYRGAEYIIIDNERLVDRDDRPICVYNNAVYYFVNHKDKTSVLMSVDLTTKERNELLTEKVSDPIECEELRNEPGISYSQRYTSAYCYKCKIIIRNMTKAIVYDLKTNEMTEIDISDSPDPREEYESIEVENNRITIVPKQGEIRTLTGERMAEMDDVAKKLYKYSRNKINVFSPKIKMEFERVAFYNDEMYIVMVLQDAGGWGYLVYYHYVPESDSLDFWCGMFISDVANRDEVSVLPYAE